MSGLRGRSAVAADHRSALPQIPGLPWWGAAIVAIAFAAIGATYDVSSGSEALGGVFAACYVLGCVLAILAVRQSGVFTAVIQPPLVLFVAVPATYYTFHASTIVGIKDLLINCGYPLIERFPLMFFTSATVLLIGIARWYLGVTARRAVPTDAEAVPVDPTAAETPARTSARRSRRSTTSRPNRAATIAAATSSANEDEEPRAPRRSSRTATPTAQRAPGAAAGSGSRRSRHARPPETESADPAASRPRRRNEPPVDPPAEPRRRTRSSDAREPRDRRPSPPPDRRGAYERSERPDRVPRPSRRERPEPSDRPERSERSDRPQRSERPQRRPRVSSDYEPSEPPPTSRPSGGSETHHPVSRVRYRDTEDGESRTEFRSRPRQSRHAAPDSWQYDV